MKAAACLAAAAALVLGLPVHAMNKCTDANGRIVYQQEPCPGAVVRGAQPKAPAAPAAAKPSDSRQSEQERMRQRRETARSASPQVGAGTTCDRVRKNIAEIEARLPIASPEQRAESESVVARARKEFGAQCGL